MYYWFVLQRSLFFQIYVFQKYIVSFIIKKSSLRYWLNYHLITGVGVLYGSNHFNSKIPNCIWFVCLYNKSNICYIWIQKQIEQLKFDQHANWKYVLAFYKTL